MTTKGQLVEMLSKYPDNIIISIESKNMIIIDSPIIVEKMKFNKGLSEMFGTKELLTLKVNNTVFK